MSDLIRGAGGRNSVAEHGEPTSVSEPVVNIIDYDELENELLEEQIFESEDSGPDHIATPFNYVVAVGRGCWKTPDPRNIRLPQAYYEDLRRKNLFKAPANSERSAGRGRTLRNFTAEIPLPNNPSHIMPMRIHQNRQAMNSLTLEKNFLGANTRGLTSEIMEGKACLMEMFLGKPVGGEAFNPFQTPQHAQHSLHSTQTAPVLNFNRRDQWPNISSGGCQSDCGQNGRRFDKVEGQTYPKKPLSLLEFTKTKSSSSTWGSNSKRDGSGGGSSAGSKNRKEESAQWEKEAVEMSEGGALPPSRAEDGSEKQNPRDSHNQPGTIPTGANLVQLDSLPEDITDAHLRAFMSCFGPVVDCHVLRDNDTQKCIGIAYVRFENMKDCQSAVFSLHQKDSPFKDSSQLQVPKLGVCMVS